MGKMLLEIIRICQSWIGEEQLVVDTIARSHWKDRVEIKSYLQDESPQIVSKYGEFSEATLVINERLKVSQISPDRLLRALEREISRSL